MEIDMTGKSKGQAVNPKIRFYNMRYGCSMLKFTLKPKDEETKKRVLAVTGSSETVKIENGRIASTSGFAQFVDN